MRVVVAITTQQTHKYQVEYSLLHCFIALLSGTGG